MNPVESKHTGEVVVVTPETPLVGGAETAEFDRLIRQLDASGNRRLVVNLEKMTFMGSPGFAALVAAYRAYHERGGRMVLCNPQERVAKFLSVVKPVFLIDVYATEEEAKGSFSRRG
jgi:anti-anti-sigma factor